MFSAAVVNSALIPDTDALSPDLLSTTLKRTAVVHLLSHRGDRLPRCPGGCKPMYNLAKIQLYVLFLIQGHQTALHRAAVVGNRDAISALIHGGCALDLQDKEGNTALHEVSWHGFSACVKLLVKAGASVKVKNKAGNTPLHLACQNGHFQTAQFLLLGGSMPDSKNNACPVGDTCLHTAARYNQMAIVKILLGSFCSVSEKNQIGDTALHVAATLNHKKTASLLLEAGADANIKNNTGQTALDKARDGNNRELAIILAKSNQVQRFARGKTVRKRRDVMRAQRKTQSLPRAQASREKGNSDAAKDINSDEGCQQLKPEHSTAALNPSARRKIRGKGGKQEHVCLREYDLYESHRVPQSSPSSQEEQQQTKAFQLYTLYRDRDGQIKQAPAEDCQCKPFIKALENKLQATEMEMRSEIHTVQEQINCRLGRIEHRNKQQMKVIEKLKQERISAERMQCHYRINRRATLEHLDPQKKQVAASSSMKSWCMSQIQDVEVRMPSDSQYYRLLRSPSAGQSPLDSEPEGQPLLSLVSEESSSSLATYVNVLPSPQGPPDTHRKSLDNGRRCYEMIHQVNGSSDDRKTVQSLVKHKPLSRKLATADLKWQSSELQEADDGENNDGDFPSKSMSEKTHNHSDGSTSDSTSPSTSSKAFNDNSISNSGWNNKDVVKTQQTTTKTLEVFSQRPMEATFIQERANLHAMEVTQRFFETVSTQLERWYERKILEAQRVAEQKALQDRENLLEKIGMLEDELQRLHTQN
ncbi:hypothetical protein DNTS_022747 [Danionella cerebrum]|uniref:Uncharacterized protein n=1 Tax=Danionella cerebrum TaxID=2873325 RepID=A0A553MXB0_9TELE|nr:hypothetical protein DNTS_022747 [Danionella translucida]